MLHEYYETRAGQYPGKAWIINYDVERALHNYHFFAAQMANNGEPGLPRVYASRDCAAIVVTNAPLDAIRDPHVMAWRSSFFELRRFDFLQRVEECLNETRRYLGADVEITTTCGAA